MPGFVWIGVGLLMGAWVMTVLKLMDAADRFYDREDDD